MKSRSTAYAFGDSALARERLGIVADAFAAPTRALLADLPPMQPRYVVDMGCGPGYTSALLRERFPHSEVTGLDASLAMVEEARTRVPGAWFVVADVTAPLRLPGDVVYARLLLGHLPDPEGALARWAAAMRPPGLLVCEEPVDYRGDDPVFARATRRWSNQSLPRTAPTCAPPPRSTPTLPGANDSSTASSSTRCRRAGPPRCSGAMRRCGATTGPARVEIVDGLRAIERDDPDADVRWRLRQTVWSRRAG